MKLIWTVSALVLITAVARAQPAPTPFPSDMPAAAPKAARPASQSLTPEGKLLSPEDLAARRKLRPFITCLNGVGGVFPLLARPYRQAYANISKNLAGGIGMSSYTWQYQSAFLFREHPIAVCADGLAKSPSQEPSDPALDSLAVAYASDLHAFQELAPKVEAYYNQNDYRDDKLAKGRAFDTDYSPLLTKLLNETGAMFDLVQGRERTLQQRRLDAIERLDGKQLRWYANAFVMQARQTVDGLRDIVVAKRVTKEAVLALVTPLETRFNEVTEYAKAHPDENNDDMNLWSKINSPAADLVKIAKDARRDVSEPSGVTKVGYAIEPLGRTFDYLIGGVNISKR